MKLETLERAKRIANEINVIEEALEQSRYLKECNFGIEKMNLLSGQMEFIALPERCKKNSVVLLAKELEVLKNALDDLIDLLNPGGRLCIITFHSLEDRIVKTAFKNKENPCTCPPEFPVCVCGKKPEGRVISKKPILPSKEELEVNSRSKSAKLRVFEKI